MAERPATESDQRIVDAFVNFLSWGEKPSRPPRPDLPSQLIARRDVPPAWYAYALGATMWCPPEGEM